MDKHPKKKEAQLAVRTRDYFVRPRLREKKTAGVSKQMKTHPSHPQSRKPQNPGSQVYMLRTMTLGHGQNSQSSLWRMAIR